jgi:hypothetical protein
MNFGSEHNNITDRDQLNTEKYYDFFSGIRKDGRRKEVVNKKSEDFFFVNLVPALQT